MDPLRLSEPLLLFALRREASSFLKEFEPQQRFPGAPCRAYFAGPSWLTVLVLETGIGVAATETALHWALGNPLFGNLPYRPRIVISAGFSGGLSPALKVGDLVLATELADVEGHTWTATWPGDLPSGTWNPPVTRGRVLTTTGLVDDPEQKRRLGEEYQAIAVDMESAVAARFCRQRGIPYGCLRSISDDWNTPLSPAVAWLAPDGRVSWWRLLAALIRSPRLMGELWRLAKQTRTAARQLGLGLGEFLTLTLDWME